MPHDVGDQVVDFVRRWSEKTEISVGRFIHWLGVTASKFYNWRERYGRVNEPNGWVPRDFWLEPWEKEAIIGFKQMASSPLQSPTRKVLFRRPCKLVIRKKGFRSEVIMHTTKLRNNNGAGHR